MTVEELRLILRLNGTSTYTHAINEVTNVTNNYTNSIGGLTSMLAKFVSAGFIAKFSKDCIEAASNLQEVSNVMNVTFGQNAVIIEQWAKTQAASFGLSEKAAKDYTGLYGTMAKQFGISLNSATKMSVELTKLTGDVASFYNTTDKIASTKLKSIFTGETESLKELGVVMTEANLNAYAMSKGISKSVKQMSEQEKVLLRYSFVMEKLQHAQGDFARTSDGWANSVRLLKLNLENLKVEIGNQFLPVAGQGLSLINKGLQTIGPVLINIAQTIRLYGEAWKNASSTTKAFMKAAIAAVAILAIAPKVIALTSSAVKLLTMDIVTLGGALKALLGIAGIVLAVASIASLSKQVEELKTADAADKLTDLGDSAEISSDAVDELSDALDGLGSSAEGLDTFLASFDEVNKVGGGNSLMSNLVNTDDLANIMAAASGLDDLSGLMDSLGGDIDELGNELSLFSGNQMFTKEWWEGVKGHIKGWWDYLKTSLKDGSWKDNFLSTWGEVDTWFQETFPKWYGFWEKFGGKVYDAVEAAKIELEPFVSQLKSWASEFADAWKTGVDEIIEKIDSLWQKYEETDFFKFWGNAGEKAYDLLNPQVTISEGRGKAHRRAAGGLPSKGSLFIAGETGPELISNFGNSQTKVVNQSQISNNTSSPIMFQPTIMIDGRKISAVVLDNINSMTRSSTQAPIIELGG